jgi:NADH-quinone oxidoreductase subunit J
MMDALLLAFFGGAALAGAVLMLVLRQPMRVALALIATMLALGGVYAVLDLHVIAVFQVLIYVGAVMVFMVYAIMLLDARDASFVSRYTPLLVPAAGAGFVLLLAIARALGSTSASGPASATTGAFGVRSFSIDFLAQYWLHFELTSVLLVVAVVAALVVIKGAGGRRG